MQPVDSRAVSMSLESYVRDRLAESDFLSRLSAGEVPPEQGALTFLDPVERTGDEALAALAGRELVVPGRNSIFVRALSEQYGITSGLEFFRSRADPEVMHFRALWEVLADDDRTDVRKLIEAARLEIWEHVAFWDDVYSTILTGGQRPAHDPVMAGNN